jgi:phosphatidate cytidylyltransferase
MTDDSWRRRRDEEEEDFGPPLFGDEATGEMDRPELSFGSGDTGPLPHWTEPPSGEVTRVTTGVSDHGDDVDVWSEFSEESPAWSDSPADDITGAYDTSSHAVVASGDETSDLGVDEAAPSRREPSRITIGTDPTGDGTRPAQRRPRQGDNRRPPRPAPGKPAAGTAGRDMPTAVAVGALLAVVFFASALWLPPFAVECIIVAVIGLAAVEYFDKVTEKGYRPATIAGILACVAMPVAAYWIGEDALPVVMVLAFAAGCITFIGGKSLEQAPMPNMAITTLGVTWIGLMGAYAALIVRASTEPGGILVAKGFLSGSVGVDTLALVVIGVVANDIGALFVGSALGKTPLREWISPNKSVEGFVGGALATLLAMLLIDITNRSTTWNSLGDLLLLGGVIAVFAPIGDLTESMFKRNLDVKDFGSLVPGHGGVLDRFDGFLLTLPAVYYLTVLLEPWVS